MIIGTFYNTIHRHKEAFNRNMNLSQQKHLGTVCTQYQPYHFLFFLQHTVNLDILATALFLLTKFAEMKN